MPVVTLTNRNSVVFDTHLLSTSSSGSPTAQVLTIGKDGAGVNRVIIKFDLGLIPNNAIINSAVLNLQQITSYGGAALTVGIHKITSDYTPSVAWANQPSFEAVATTTLAFSDTNGARNLNVKNLVQEWVNGTTNYGMLVKATDETIAYPKDVGSFDNTTNANQPTLTIDYTIPTTGKKQVEYVGCTPVVNGSAIASLSVPFPAGTKTGDLVVVQMSIGTNVALNVPAGWTKIDDRLNNNYRGVIAYRIVTSGETSAIFNTGSTPTGWGAVAYTFRNAKGINASNYYNYTSSTASVYTPMDITTTVDKTLLVLFNSQIGNRYDLTVPLGFSELADVFGNAGGLEASMYYMHLNRFKDDQETLTRSFSGTAPAISVGVAIEPITNNPPTLTLTSPSDNLLGTDGNCEDTSKFTYTGGTAALDNTRKTQGNNSIKITKNSTSSSVYGKTIYPNVGDCYLFVADVYLEAVADAARFTTLSSGVTSTGKGVTPTAGGYSATTLGQFVPIVNAYKVTTVTTPGASYLQPAIYHMGVSGQIYNFDSFRVFKISQEEYDALGTNVTLAQAQAIAAQYPYIDPANNNQVLSEGTLITIPRNKDVAINILANDIDAADTLQYAVMRNTTYIQNYTSISKNVQITYTIPYSSLLIGNNPIAIKVKDSSGGETVINFTIYVNANLPLGYSCLNDLKPYGYSKSTISLSEIINYLS